MAKNSPRALREAILSRRNDYVESTTNGHTVEPIPKNGKTHLMLLIEQHWEQSIEELIWEDSINKVADKLAISASVVSYWRKKFPLEKYSIGRNNRKVPQ